MKSSNASKWLRIFSLAGFLGFLTWFSYMHQVQGGGITGYPPIDVLCPLGGLETLYSWITEGNLLRRLAPSALILFFITGGMTLILGRVFCGWICPLGAVGEFFAFLGKKFKFPQIKVPKTLDSTLKLLKYILLAVILMATWQMGTLAFRDYDPWVAWAHLSEGFAEFGWGHIMLFVTVIGASLFIERFWCRYLCPLGAALGILGKASLLKVGNAKPKDCKHCGLCPKSCPVQLNPEDGIVSGAECLACGKCVQNPFPTCDVQFSLLGKPVTVLAVGVLTLALFFGGYGAAKGLGYWSIYVTPPKTLSVVTEDGKSGKVIGKEIPNPYDIRGSVTLLDLQTTYGLSPEAILKEAGWPQDISYDVPLKELKTQLDKELDEIREAVKRLIK